MLGVFEVTLVFRYTFETYSCLDCTCKMILKRYFFLLFILAVALPARAALIRGVFKNASLTDQVELYVPHFYIDGKSSSYKVALGAQGEFTLEADIPEPQLVFLIHQEDRLPIFLEPQDTLVVRADLFQFPLVVNFSGSGGANNSVLLQYFRENAPDFNEFNNLRFKIGQWWASVEEPLNSRMEDLPPTDFRAAQDKRKVAAFALLDEFSNQHPDALSPVFYEWLTVDITYNWAYTLLFYGQVYGGRHFIQPEFFAFMQEVPVLSEMIGNDAYRQFLLALLARQQAKSSDTGNFWIGEYQLAGDLLSGKALAFMRSEAIRMGFSGDQYRELLPIYTDFLQKNTFAAYDVKVTELFEKVSRVAGGAPAPAFTALDVTGKTVSLQQFRGKVVYLNFWASWCSACLQKMEFFNEFAPELHSQGVEIINVSIDQNLLSWQTALTERGFKGVNLLASAASGRNLATIFDVEAVPQYFIIGKDGKFADKASSNQPNDIRERLLQLAKPR